MSLFERITDFEFPEEAEKIWNYITSKGTPKFNKSELEKYWREFSEEEYCAGYMTYSEFTAEEFITWLENYND